MAIVKQILPGVYANIIAGDRDAALSARGTVAMALDLDWGASLTTLLRGNSTIAPLGYDLTDPKLKLVREVMQNAGTLLLYRLNAKKGQPAQGTLALELRADNAKLMAKLDALSDEKTNLCAGIEREFLKRIGGNCHLPVAAYCDIVSEKDRGNDSNKNNRLKLLAMFGSEDGKQLARTEQIWDMTSDRNNIVERAVHDIRYKLEID